jgi:hypothetical protein
VYGVCEEWPTTARIVPGMLRTWEEDERVICCGGYLIFGQVLVRGLSDVGWPGVTVSSSVKQCVCCWFHCCTIVLVGSWAHEKQMEMKRKWTGGW